MVTTERLRFSYDLVAAKYEERFRDELQGKARDREPLESLAGSVGDPIVEIGCGPGQPPRPAGGSRASAASAAGFDIIRAERREPYPSEGQTVRLYVEGQRRAASSNSGTG